MPSRRTRRVRRTKEDAARRHLVHRRGRRTGIPLLDVAVAGGHRGVGAATGPTSRAPYHGHVSHAAFGHPGYPARRRGRGREPALRPSPVDDPKAPLAADVAATGAADGAREAAFSALWRSHASALRSYALGSTGRADVADDVVQETFSRAWHHGGVVDGSVTSPRAWLFTVARNVLVDRERRQGARPVLVAEQLEQRGAIDEGFDAAIEADVLASALDRLSPDHRAVVCLGLAGGRSVAEVARLLGIPEGTVKSRTYYALRALRVALDELGYVR